MPPKPATDSSGVNLDVFTSSPPSAQQKEQWDRFIATIPAESPSTRRTTRSATRDGAAPMPPAVSPAPPLGTKRPCKKKVGPQPPASNDVSSDSAPPPSISAPQSIPRSLTEDMNNYLGGSEGMEDIVAALNDRELLTPTPESPTKEPEVPKVVDGHLAAILPSAQAKPPVAVKPSLPTKMFPPPVGKFSPPNPLPTHFATPSPTKSSSSATTASSDNDGDDDATPQAKSHPEWDATPSRSPSPSLRLASQAKQRLGRPPDQNRVLLEELFTYIVTTLRGVGEKLGVSEQDVCIAFERWVQGKQWASEFGTSAQTILTPCFEDVKKHIGKASTVTSNTITNIMAKFHTQFIATPRAPNTFNQYEAMSRVVQSYKQLGSVDAVAGKCPYLASLLRVVNIV
jgi:hypothetical protein